MFSFLQNIFNNTAHPLERSFDALVSKKEVSSKDILILMNSNLAVCNLYLEYKYKKYKQLKVSDRRRLYKNAEKLKAAFLNFNKNKKTDPLSTIMAVQDFLHKHCKYQYREATAFSELLKDPQTETLIGDCNQMVTLSLFLFSQLHPVETLQLKTPPGHVCLHYQGQDIETTNGTLTQHTKGEVLAVTELFALNLLDVSDSKREQFNLSPKRFLESAHIAKALSSNTEITDHNLEVAYGNIVKALIKKEAFPSARDYAKQSGIQKLITYTEGSYAQYFVAKKQYKEAAKVFTDMGDNKRAEQCYALLYNQENEKLDGIKTIAELKKKRPILKNMKELARKSKNKKLQEHAEKLWKQIA